MATVRSDPADIAVAFGQVLRGLGLRVPSSSTHAYADALCAVGLEQRDGVYWAGRATLIRRPEDIDPYDRAFAVFFEGRSGQADLVEPEPIHLTLAVDTDDDSTDDDDDSSATGRATTRRSSCASRPPRSCATRISPPTTTTNWPTPRH